MLKHTTWFEGMPTKNDPTKAKVLGSPSWGRCNDDASVVFGSRAAKLNYKRALPIWRGFFTRWLVFVNRIAHLVA
jgi:hypothetical protein